MDRRDRHHDRDIPAHIFRQFRIDLSHFIQINTLGNDLRHQDLLVDPAHQHLFIDGLVFPADVVMIQVDVHIKNMPDERQRLIGKDIIHIKSVFRQNHPAAAQHLCPEDQRMHDQILRCMKSSDIVPVTHFLCRENIAVLHDTARSFFQMVVNIIAYKQIRHLTDQTSFFSHTKSPDPRKQSGICRLIQPVIRIHHLKIGPCRQLQPLVDAGPMAAVLLVDRPDDTRIPRRIIVCDLCRGICGTVIYNNDLHVLSAGEQRIDAPLHIIL